MSSFLWFSILLATAARAGGDEPNCSAPRWECDASRIISSATVITGERLQTLADVTVVTEDWLDFHRSLRGVLGTSLHHIVIIDENGRIRGDDAEQANARKALAQARTVFVYTHLLAPFFLGETFLTTRLGIVLISHNGDDSIRETIAASTVAAGAEGFPEGHDSPTRQTESGYSDGQAGSMRGNASFQIARPAAWERVAASALDSGRVRRWFAQNNLSPHPMITTLPIGVANSMWPHGDTELLCGVARQEPAQPHAKDGWLFANFKVSEHAPLRAQVMTQVAALWFATLRCVCACAAILASI